jgi:hypothetical protein
MMERQVRIASTLNFLLAFWLIGAPFAFQYQGRTASTWNEMIVGGIVLVFSGIRIFNPLRSVWMSWANALLGAWLAVSPFALSFSAAGNGYILANDMLVGAGFILFSLWSAYATRQAMVS